VKRKLGAAAAAGHGTAQPTDEKSYFQAAWPKPAAETAPAISRRGAVAVPRSVRDGGPEAAVIGGN